MTLLNEAIKSKNWILAKEFLIKSPEQIDKDTLSFALNSGNISIICDVIEAGAKPNDDSLICAALSAPPFLNTVLSMLRAEGKEIKKTIIEKYGQINTQSLLVSAIDAERISHLEQIQFWQAVWKRSSNPNFHAQQVKPHLKQLLATLNIMPGQGIFVPFCGKSVDMLWLQQQGYCVLGVDISKEAIDDFCNENGLQYSETQKNGLLIREIKSENAPLTLICGDIFKLQASDVADISVIYDRAGYIAIPKELRVKYANLLANIFPENTKMLLGLFNFENEKPFQGPPHYISEEEIQTLLSPTLQVHTFTETRAEFFATPNEKKTVETPIASNLLKGIISQEHNIPGSQSSNEVKPNPDIQSSEKSETKTFKS